jgi:hypothetical protein
MLRSLPCHRFAESVCADTVEVIQINMHSAHCRKYPVLRLAENGKDFLQRATVIWLIMIVYAGFKKNQAIS